MTARTLYGVLGQVSRRRPAYYGRRAEEPAPHGEIYMSIKPLALAVLTAVLMACSPTDTPDSPNTASTPDTGTSAVLAEGHFHPKGKAPSEYTLAIFEEARETLPFSDRQDFEEWERGFIARREDLQHWKHSTESCDHSRRRRLAVLPLRLKGH